MPEFRCVTEDDFETVFTYVKNLWDYNKYSRDAVRPVFEKMLQDGNSFMFFIEDDGEIKGWCHGDYFQTFWMSGETCYISSLITNRKDRGKGYGRLLVDHARKLAEDRGCRAIILDSGLPRKEAHKFYEKYGFEKSCYGFELIL